MAVRDYKHHNAAIFLPAKIIEGNFKKIAKTTNPDLLKFLSKALTN
tara:strand:- start:74 stop:211 length:138 start_codon:yes stop_codon:yes gene_type:complete